MKKVILLLTIFTFIISCQEENNSDTIPEVSLEKVLGKITSPSGKAIPNASIYYDDNGTIYQSKTNLLGEFEIEVPLGLGRLEIQTGNGKLFNSSIDINVTEGQTLDLRSENIILNSSSNLAFLAGSYDAIQEIITELGYTATEVTVDDITNNNLSNYNALFLNCNNNIAGMNETFYSSLNTFVVNGNSLYASDWSLEYLAGFAAPNGYGDCSLERPGGFIADDLICGSRSGLQTTLENNSILNSDIVNFVGTENINILYDLPTWMQVQNYANDFWEVLIEDENQQALMLKTNQVEGNTDDSIWYSDNGNKVTICHIPPGNPENAHSITISVNALDAHLAHGDTIGDCNATSGNIYYTTFHNHIGEETNPIIEQMMEYIILNL